MRNRKANIRDYNTGKRFETPKADKNAFKNTKWALNIKPDTNTESNR